MLGQTALGLYGNAWGWVLAYPLVVFPLYRKTFQTIGASGKDYFRAPRLALSGTIAMIPTVEWMKLRFVPGQPP